MAPREYSKMYTVRVLPADLLIEIDGETSLKHALNLEGIIVKSSCGGFCSCGECIVKVVLGEDNLVPPSFNELAKLGNVFHITKERLACQTFITGNVTIDITDHLNVTSEFAANNKPKKAPTHVRKKDDVSAMIEERKKTSSEKRAKQAIIEKHWEQEDNPLHARKLGGNKRPKTFTTEDEGFSDSNNDDDKKNFKKAYEKKSFPKKPFEKKPSENKPFENKSSENKRSETSGLKSKITKDRKQFKKD